jgi:hypothetical protein
MSFETSAATSPTARTPKGRNAFDAWQAHVRKSSAAARDTLAAELDTVRLFYQRGRQSFARRLHVAAVLREVAAS